LQKVCVKVGDRIERGTIVAIVESMKMEFPLKAERGGLVTAVHAEEGAQIAGGTVLAVLDDGNG
jgi:biotin carboxyl carrier protein